MTKQRNVGKKFVLFSFSRDPDPILPLEGSRPLPPFLGPWTPYQPTQDLTLSFPTFLSGEYGCWWKRGTSLILELLGWLNVWLLWVWTATNSVDMHTLFGKWLGKNKTWLIKSIWKGRIEYSPLKEFAFNQKQSLIGDLVSTITAAVDPGEAAIWEDMDDLAEAQNRQEGQGSLSWKASMHFSVCFFPIG